MTSVIEDKSSIVIGLSVILLPILMILLLISMCFPSTCSSKTTARGFAAYLILLLILSPVLYGIIYVCSFCCFNDYKRDRSEFNFKSGDNTLNFQEDIYALTYIAHLFESDPERSLIIIQPGNDEMLKNPRNGQERVIKENELASYFKSCVFIFLIQVTLAFYSLKGLDSAEYSKIGMMIKDGEMTILIVRFLCALALHMQIEGEILQGIKFMKISLYMVTTLDKRMPLFILGFM